jgi:hypothetical protein
MVGEAVEALGTSRVGSLVAALLGSLAPAQPLNEKASRHNVRRSINRVFICFPINRAREDFWVVYGWVRRPDTTQNNLNVHPAHAGCLRCMGWNILLSGIT